MIISIDKLINKKRLKNKETNVFNKIRAVQLTIPLNIKNHKNINKIGHYPIKIIKDRNQIQKANHIIKMILKIRIQIKLDIYLHVKHRKYSSVNKI